MSGRLANQARVFLGLLNSLGPALSRDRHFPERVRVALADRRFGSRDRRVYRELSYTAFRHWAWFTELREQEADRAVAACVWLAGTPACLAPWRESWLDGWPSLPSGVGDRAAHLGVKTSLFPLWWAEAAPSAQGELDTLALLSRGPVWLRVQRDLDRVRAWWSEQGWPWEVSPWADTAVRLPDDVDITRTPLFEDGRVEIQDVGSQRILATAPAQPGERWLDACAGAGGKTLQLATQVCAYGRVTAYEPRDEARRELADRARRARFQHIEIRRQPPAPHETFDGVLVDAPCSGSGTWRRMPHLRAQTSRADITEAARRQQDILTTYARHVRPGGRLVYATCSLCDDENQGVVRTFLAAHRDFSLVSPSETPHLGRLYRPGEHDGDGFFASYLIRR